MQRSLYSPPEPFSLLPLLVLLPVRGDVRKLPALSTALYARYEKVKGVLESQAEDAEPAVRHAYAAEEAMLKLVLEWTDSYPEALK